MFSNWHWIGQNQRIVYCGRAAHTHTQTHNINYDFRMISVCLWLFFKFFAEHWMINSQCLCRYYVCATFLYQVVTTHGAMHSANAHKTRAETQKKNKKINYLLSAKTPFRCSSSRWWCVITPNLLITHHSRRRKWLLCCWSIFSFSKCTLPLRCA